MKHRSFMLLVPLLTLSATPLFAQELQDLVRSDPPVAPADELSADFREELGELVSAWAAGSPWAPWYRDMGAVSRILFWSPAETVVSVAHALPYLEPSAHDAAVAALDAFVADHPPLEEAFSVSQAAGSIDMLADPANAVTWRGYAPPPGDPDVGEYNFWPYPEVHPYTLYAVWAYAHYADRPAYVEEHWTRIREIYDAIPRPAEGQELWALAQALVGATRLARLHGDETMAAEAEGLAVAALERALDFAAHAQSWDEHSRVQTFALPLYSYGPTGETDSGIKKIARAFPREVLRAIAMSAPAREQLGAYIDPFVHVNDYTFGPTTPLRTDLVDWWATEHGGWTSSEGGFLSPEVSWGLFLSHVYGLGANQNPARLWLDVGWCRADLTQIDKLVAAIEAVPGDEPPPDPTLEDGNEVEAPPDAATDPSDASADVSDLAGEGKRGGGCACGVAAGM